jgi:hypothetical protein
VVGSNGDEHPASVLCLPCPPNGNLWLLGGEYSGPGLLANWTNTGEVYDPLSDAWSPITSYPPQSGCPGGRPACFGDDPSMLLPGGRILAGSLLNGSTYIYDIASDTWSFAASKNYNDSSDEEGWVKLPGNQVLTYDLFQSVATAGSYAERYDSVTNTWSSVSPSDGTAFGTIPQLSSGDVGFEQGAPVRLRDGRIFFLGATGHTALYSPSTNTWGAGPDIIGTLSGNPGLFGADDAPAAVLPSGHVLFAADAGPAAVRTTGDTTIGSAIITGIPTTEGFQPNWIVAGTGIVAGSRILTVDSLSQVRISQNATTTNSGVSLKFGGTFSNPTQIFDFNPVTNTISQVESPAANLANGPAYVTRMLVLPTGQVLFSDGTSLLWVYTPRGAPLSTARPVIGRVKYSGAGVFTLRGKQLNGQSAGASYGDDAESDENYPIVRLTVCGHKDDRGQEAEFEEDGGCLPSAARTRGVFYARTTNWSTVDVATGSMRETVNFTLQPGMSPGRYSLEVIGAGISSLPMVVHITAAEIGGL